MHQIASHLQVIIIKLIHAREDGDLSPAGWTVHRCGRDTASRDW